MTDTGLAPISDRPEPPRPGTKTTFPEKAHKGPESVPLTSAEDEERRQAKQQAEQQAEYQAMTLKRRLLMIEHLRDLTIRGFPDEISDPVELEVMDLYNSGKSMAELLEPHFRTKVEEILLPALGVSCNASDGRTRPDQWIKTEAIIAESLRELNKGEAGGVSSERLHAHILKNGYKKANQTHLALWDGLLAHSEVRPIVPPKRKNLRYLWDHGVSVYKAHGVPMWQYEPADDTSLTE